MIPSKTLTQKQVTLDFPQEIYNQLQSQYKDLTEFMDILKSFIYDLTINKTSYNINAFPDPFNKGIYILGKDDFQLNILPDSKLALKCSQGYPWLENLRKQFYRSLQLSRYFETKLNAEEKNLLQICPVYLHFQTSKANSFFKQILFMQRIDGAVALGQTKTGFNEEFCKAFKIPSLEEIYFKPQFALHLALDKNKQRQLLKIQTVYLYKRLLKKGINILSLNQKNILVSQVSETGKTKYIIIDTTLDWFMPVSPLYNILTSNLCT
jgi:hypothetical protein